MMRDMNDAMLRLYVGAISGPRALAMARAERGQAFTDYLMVVALLVLLAVGVGGLASTAFKDGASALMTELKKTVSVTGSFKLF